VGAKASLPLARLTASFWERRLPPIRISDEWIASQSDVGDALPAGSWIPSSLMAAAARPRQAKLCLA
jgi:hypothetical protein